MKARAGQTFQVAKLTGIVKSASAEGAVIGFALVSKSGFTRTFVGDMTVLFTRGDSRRVQMLLAIAPRYHDVEFLKDLRSTVFSALGISDEETWALNISPSVVIGIDSKPSDGWIELTSSG
jgi:hypothetical protein